MGIRVTAVLSMLMAMGTLASAETLGGWSYTPPAGFEAALTDALHAYTRVDGNKFCRLGLYAPRKEGSSTDADVTKEWKTIVEPGYTVSGATKVSTSTTKGRTRHTRGAKLATADGTYYGQLVVVRENGMVISILTLSNSAQTINSCQPAVAAITSSLASTQAAPVAAPAAASAASASSLVGEWGVDTALRQHNSDNWMNGYVRYQYALRADGTYSFRKEVKVEGSPKTTFDNYVETGTYKVDGTTLTITPKTSNHVKRDVDGKVLSSAKMKLETVSYTWKQTPGGEKETLLILTPSSPTTREGTPNGGTFAPGGYILTNPKTMFFKY